MMWNFGTTFLAAVVLIGALQSEDKIKDKQREISIFLKAHRTERELRVALDELRGLSSQAIAINSYDLAAKLLEQAEKISRSLKDIQQTNLIKEQIQKTTTLKREYEKVLNIELRISSGEGKPDDYFAVGRFYAVVKGDWQAALQFLVKSSDAKLKAAAESDLALPKSADEQVSAGDQWWSVGENYKERAIHWYSQAWPSLRGVTREKVRARLKDGLRHKEGGSLLLPSPWTSLTEKGRARGDLEYSHSGRISLRLEAAPADAYNRFNWIGNGKLTFSCWVLSDGNDVGDLAWLLFADTGGKGLRIQLPVDCPFWSKVEQDVEIPAGSTGISIALQRNSKTETIWIDDVSVKSEAGNELIQNGTFEDK